MVTRIETRSLRFLLLEGVEHVGGISIAFIISVASVMAAIALFLEPLYLKESQLM
jgi:hypothetical protein